MYQCNQNHAIGKSTRVIKIVGFIIRITQFNLNQVLNHSKQMDETKWVKNWFNLIELSRFTSHIQCKNLDINSSITEKIAPIVF